MNKSITVTIKSVYGVDRVYPVCEVSKLLAKLIRTKTFSKYHIEIIKQLEYDVNVETKTI